MIANISDHRKISSNGSGRPTANCTNTRMCRHRRRRRGQGVHAPPPKNVLPPKVDRVPSFGELRSAKSIFTFPPMGHRRRNSVNFRGARHFCPKNMHDELTKFPKNARILHNNCPKNIFPNFRGARAPLPPFPTPMRWA